MKLFIINREGPVDLLVAGGTEEIARIVVQCIRPLEPLFVEPQAVGVPRLDDVPGVIQLVAELFVFRQIFGEVFQHHGADGLDRKSVV